MSDGDQHGGETLEEHRTVRGLVAEADTLVVEPDPQGQWMATLCEKLESLRGHLRQHFGREAQSYLFQELPAQYPHHKRRLERLEGEHDEILRRLDHALEQSQRGCAGEEIDSDRLRGRVRNLLTTIRRHEAEEDEILLGAYWDDLGEGD